MAYCDQCGNFDHAHEGDESSPSFQPDLYYYWDAPIEEIYYWRDSFPDVSFQCFYDEPGCEIAGYYQDSLISVTQFAHTVQKWVILKE